MIRRLVIIALLPVMVAGQAKYGGELFELPGGSRSLAMGGGGVTSLHGAVTGLYNPALIAHVERASLMLSHREQFGGMVTSDLLATSLKGTSNLAVQLSILRRGTDGIPDTRRALEDLNGNGILDDDERLNPDNVSWFNDREWGLALSVAKRNQSGFQFGGSLKLLGHWLADGLGLGMGVDVGIARYFGDMLTVGLMLQDLTTTQIYWNTGTWETIMPRLTLGAGLHFEIPLIHRPLSLEGELTVRLDGERLENAFVLAGQAVLARAGLELELTDNLSLRSGTSTHYPISMGLGLDFPAFKLDYAYIGSIISTAFEPTHQVTLSLYIDSLRQLLD